MSNKKEALKREGHGSRQMWKQVVLTHQKADKIINAEWSQNTVGEMSEFLRYTVPDDCVILVQQGVLRAKLFEADGATEVLLSEHGYICGIKPQDTLVKELAPWDYDVRAELTYPEQLNSDYTKSLVVRFPGDKGYFIHPKQILIFQINSSRQLPAAANVHDNARWYFPVLMFTQSAETFVEWRTKGLIDYQALSSGAGIALV